MRTRLLVLALLAAVALWGAQAVAPSGATARLSATRAPAVAPPLSAPSAEVQVAGSAPRVVLSHEDRVEVEAAVASEARANRQQLLFRTLQDLKSAAERAEREGKPEYAAALRHRAEVLGQSVQIE